MGKKAGDTVKIATPQGVREFELRSFETIYDQG
jgi:hypothetical protein